MEGILQKIKAVIFDMDGVLVDSERAWFQTTKDWLSHLIGKMWGEHEYSRIIGKSIPDIYRSLHKRYTLHMSEQDFFDKYMKLAQDVYMRHASLNPYVEETLKAIHCQRVPCAIASSSPHSSIQMVISRFSLAPYFSAIVSSEDVGFRGKPAPDIYLYTAQKLSVSPKQCIVIEDSRNGVLAAKAAGMIALGYRTPHNQNQNLDKADIIITDLSEITSKYIHALNQT